MVWLLCSNVYAQRVTVTPLPTQLKMPVTNIHAIMQDSEGYMWYATYGGGLCRDNGYDIDVFRSDRFRHYPLTNNDVISMEESSTGDIWFSTRTGVYKLSKRDYSISLLDARFNNKRAICMQRDKSGQMWMAVGTDILRLTSNGQVTTIYPCTYGRKPAYPVSICISPTGTVWGSQWNGGIFYIRNGRMKTLKWSYPFWPSAMVADEKRKCLWIGTWGGGICQLKYRNGQWIITPQPTTIQRSGEQYNQIINLQAEFDADRLWTSTMTGLYVYHIDSAGKLQVEAMEGYEQDEENIVIDNLCRDRKNNLWVAGFSPHTFIISHSEKDIRHYGLNSDNTALSNIKIMMMAMGTNGFWLFKDRLGLSFYDKNSQNEISCRLQELTGVIAESQDGSLWAGAVDKQIYRIRRQNDRCYVQRIIRPSEVATVLTDNQNGQLFIGTKKSLLCYDYRNDSLYALDDSTSLVRDIAISPRGTLYYISTKHGLCRLGGTTLAPYNQFNHLAIDNRGRLWVSNSQGCIYLYRHGQLSEVKSASTDDGNNVLSMLFDKKGHLWVVSDMQVKEYNPRSGISRIYHVSDNRIGLGSFGIAIRSGQGVCVGGTGGVCFLHTSYALQRNKTDDALVAVSGYVIREQKHFLAKGQKTLTLSASDSKSVELQFTTFDPLHASVTRFAYQLKGLSNEWVMLDEGENKARLLGLPKGTYHLLLRATDENGQWGKVSEVLTICRQPFWWETWWAYLIYVFATLLTGYAVWRYNQQMRYRRDEFDRLLHLLREKDTLLSSYAQVPFLVDEKSVSAQIVSEPLGENMKCEETLTNRVSLEDANTLLTEESIILSDQDQQLLDRAMSLVKEHMSDENYDVDAFAHDMLMSRATLLRRIRSVAGQSPTDFIKTIRLEHATQLILHSNYSLAAISDLCGFSSASYFTKCFKQKYGVLPKNYKA